MQESTGRAVVTISLEIEFAFCFRHVYRKSTKQFMKSTIEILCTRTNAVFHIKFMRKSRKTIIFAIVLGNDCYQFTTNDCLIMIVSNMIRWSRR